MKRILSVDFGTKNVGFAVSDALGITAQPLPVYRRISPERDDEHVKRLVEEYSVEKIVVGLPLHLDGSESELSAAARNFGARISSAAGVPSEFYDERMTTGIVDRMLTEEADVSRAKRKKVKDKLAAVVILQNYLDSKSAAQ